MVALMYRLVMYTNAVFAVMVSHMIGRSRIFHGNPMDNASASGMIARVSGNRSSCNGYPADNTSCNKRIHHSKPADSASTAGLGKPNTVYIGKNLYPISILQLKCFSEIA